MLTQDKKAILVCGFEWTEEIWCCCSKWHYSQHMFNNFAGERLYNGRYFIRKSKGQKVSQGCGAGEGRSLPRQFPGAHEGTKDALNVPVNYKNYV